LIAGRWLISIWAYLSLFSEPFEEVPLLAGAASDELLLGVPTVADPLLVFEVETAGLELELGAVLETELPLFGC
jgi:hypothetical protein